MKKYFPVIIGGFILFAGSMWWLTRSQPEQVEDHAGIATEAEGGGVATPGDEAVTGQDGETAVKADEPTPGKSARTIRLVPDSSSNNDADADRKIDPVILQSVTQMLESSLAGTVEDSVNLGQLLSRCGDVPRSEAQVQKNVQTANKRFAAGKKQVFGYPESKAFESFEDIEAFAWEKYEQCLAIGSIFDNTMHRQITRLADSGNIIARYLYAMWPPSLGGRVRTGKMPEWLEYQHQALEYTWQNIEAGEPLGFLAYGQSFSDSDPGLFTPMNLRYAQVFFMAAQNCGLESLSLNTMISAYEAGLTGNRGEKRLGRMEIHADEITALFCH